MVALNQSPSHWHPIHSRVFTSVHQIRVVGTKNNMSLAARSTQQGLAKVQDENGRFAAKQMKPSATAQGRRVGGALSDITNVASHQQANQGASKVCCPRFAAPQLAFVDNPTAHFLTIMVVPVANTLYCVKLGLDSQLALHLDLSKKRTPQPLLEHLAVAYHTSLAHF